MAFCWAHFLFNCHLLLGKRSVTAIFFFFQATSSFVKQQDQQKNPFTLNTAHREPSFWRERNSFGYNEIVPGPALDSKGRPQMHLRFPWWKISFSAEKKIPFTFLQNGFLNSYWSRFTSSGSDEIEHSKDEDRTNTLETLRCIFKSCKKFPKYLLRC